MKELQNAVLARFNNPTHTICRAFPSSEAAKRFVLRLRREDPTLCVQTARFYLPDDAPPEMSKWTAFSVVLFHESLEEAAFEFWEWFGDGISSRHAEFSFSQFTLLNSQSDYPEYQSVGPDSSECRAMTLPDWIKTSTPDKMAIKSRLASSASSADSGLKHVGKDDVLLFATGMAAISFIGRTLAGTYEDSGAVVYGLVQPYE